jgi:hypothetical protein
MKCNSNSENRKSWLYQLENWNKQIRFYYMDLNNHTLEFLQEIILHQKKAMEIMRKYLEQNRGRK